MKIAAKDVDAARPNYLVIFKASSERNTSTLSTVLKRGAAKGVSSKSSRVAMLAAGDTGVVTRVYQTLGVAATDLTDAQAQALKKRDDVAAVVLNEVRFLPPPRRSVDMADLLGAGASAPAGAEPMHAYLKGLRDAASASLVFAGGQLPAFEAGVAAVATVAPSATRNTWGLGAIGATQMAAPTGRGIKVAVLDTGIDLLHPDMGLKVVEGQTAVSFVTNVSVQDVFGHGTHCAGTVCGPDRSASGIRYGVAPNVELLVGKVFNNRARPSASDDDILEGIQWADENGARIISMSLGSDRDVGEGFSVAYETLASRLLNRTTDSVLIVAAAGNESDRPSFTAPVGNPAACPSIMAVAAVDRRRRIADFSCRKMDAIGEVNVSGPGVGVFSSTIGGSFEVLDGTSMATPHTAGLAALYLEANPSLTAKQLFKRLQQRAHPLGSRDDFGAGLIHL